MYGESIGDITFDLVTLTMIVKGTHILKAYIS